MYSNAMIQARWLSALLSVVVLHTCLLANPVFASEAEEATEDDKALYLKFHPNFIVNLQDGHTNFLMVTVQGMSRDQKGINLARHHMAAIRHHILMLLSEQTLASVRSADGKRSLMDQALVEVQELMTEETGEPYFEAILFTDFVIE